MNHRTPLRFALLVAPSLYFLATSCSSEEDDKKKLTTTSSTASSSAASGAGGEGGAGGGVGGAGGGGGAGGLGGAGGNGVGGAGGSGGQAGVGGAGGGGGGGTGGGGGAGGAPPKGFFADWADYSKDANAVEKATALATDPSGNVLLAGTFNGLITIDKMTKGPAAKNDVYLAKLTKDGKHVWSKQLMSLGSPAVTGIATDANGGIVIVGRFDDELTIGNNTKLVAPNKSNTMFVARLDAQGNAVWSKAIGDVAEQHVTDVTVDKAGNIVLTGYFKGVMDFGKVGGNGAPVVITATDAYDVFLAKIDPQGNPVFASRFGGFLDQLAYGVATDGANNIAVVGSFYGNIDFGGGTFNTPDGNAFAASFTPQGAHRWSKNMGGANFQEARSVRFDSANDALVTGYFGASMLLDQVITSNGEEDIFVTKIAGPTGDFKWSVSFGDKNPQRALDLTVSSKDEPIVVGYANGTVTVGATVLNTKGLSDVIAIKLDAAGKPLWAGSWGGAGVDEATHVVRSMLDEPILAGNFTGEIDLGPGLWTAAITDLFLARLPVGP
jgi:hypothetical protein